MTQTPGYTPLPPLRRGKTGYIITPTQLLDEGGEGEIYRIAEAADLILKQYRNPTPEHDAKLRTMLVSNPTDLMGSKGHIAAAWPVDRVIDAYGVCVGFLMPYIRATDAIRLLNLYIPSMRRRYAPPYFTWRHLIRTACNLARVLDVLHTRNYVVGDLNESNILVSTGAFVTLVDCDSMQIPRIGGGMFHCKVAKDPYAPPELQGYDLDHLDRVPSSDNFALAVLIFQILMESIHPFAGIWLGGGTPLTEPKDRIRVGGCPYTDTGARLVAPPRGALPFYTLPPGLQVLVKQCFGEGLRKPSRRPTAYEWYQALDKAEQGLTQCGINQHHLYSDHLQACPWCERMRLGIPDPFPPLQQLYQSARAVYPAQQPASAKPQPSSPPPQPQTATQQSIRQRQRNAVSWIGLLVLLVIGLIVFVSVSRGETSNPGSAPATPIVGQTVTSAPTSATYHPTKYTRTFPVTGYSQGSVNSISLSPNKQFLAIATGDGVLIWDDSNGKENIKEIRHLDIGTGYNVIVWSLDGRYLAAGGWGIYGIRIWDTNSWQVYRTWNGDALIYSLSFSPDGSKIVAMGTNSSIMYIVGTNGQLITAFTSQNGFASSPIWSPNGKYIISGRGYNTVLFLNPENGSLIKTLTTDFREYQVLGISSDGKQFATFHRLGEKTMLRIFSYDTLSYQDYTISPTVASDLRISWPPKSNKIAVYAAGYDYYRLYILDLISGSLSSVSDDTQYNYKYIEWSPKYNLLFGLDVSQNTMDIWSFSG